ncbi:unnamed protein product [Sphenostylis stenocarpa]|uniref:Uncharacterized protein n=1 Tax=Sphenostylis stenocarpa TaxID=92480 RepID=A0AA86SV72_9FABA|nr:unnamed protein product [Sphenostylis stenocarpa]
MMLMSQEKALVLRREGSSSIERGKRKRQMRIHNTFVEPYDGFMHRPTRFEAHAGCHIDQLPAFSWKTEGKQVECRREGINVWHLDDMIDSI